MYRIANILAALVLAAGGALGGRTQSALAGPQGWTTMATPATSATPSIGLGILNANIAAIAVSPAFASDSTLFAAIDSAVGDGVTDGIADDLAVSNDGGRTWNIRDPDGGSAAGIVGVVVSPNFAVDRTVVIASETTVYRSSNAGVTWVVLGGAQGGAGSGSANRVITSVSISPNYDGVGVIMIGLADSTSGVAALPVGGGVRVWGLEGILNWVVPGTALSEDVTAVAFSPSYSLDGAMLAIGSRADTGGSDTRLHILVGATTSAAVPWDASGGPTPISTDDDLGAAAGMRTSSLALGANFNLANPDLRTFWAGINTVAGGTGDLLRGSALTSTVAAGLLGASATDIRSLAIDGTQAGGTLLAGTAGNAVFKCTGISALAPICTAATTAPAPGTAVPLVSNTVLALAPNYATSGIVFAGNSGGGGAAADEQTGFARSRDGGVTFQQISLIDAAGSTTAAGVRFADVGVSGSTIFLSTVDDGPLADALWRSSDSGATWDRLDTMEVTDIVAVPGVSPLQERAFLAISPTFAADGFVAWVDGGSPTGATVRRSLDGGNSFTNVAAAGTSGVIASIALLDGSTILVGSAGATPGLRRTGNSGFFWTGPALSGATTNISNIVRSPGYASSGTVVVGDGAGRVFLSTDRGLNFTQLGGVAVAGNVSVAFDSRYESNGVLYAAGSTAGAGIARWTVATQWGSIDAQATAGYGALAVTATVGGYANHSLVAGGDGTLFGADARVGGNGLRRSVNPSARAGSLVDFAVAPEFNHVNNASPTTTFGVFTLGPAAWSGNLANDTVYAVRMDAAPDTLVAYTDQFSNPQARPTPVSPVEDAVAGQLASGATTLPVGAVQLLWQNVNGANGYQAQLATDELFTQIVAGETQIVATRTGTTSGAFNLTALDGNRRYYWRSRAIIDNGLVAGVGGTAGADMLSRWSQPSSFIAGTAAPNLISPVFGSANYSDVPLKPLFVWSEVNGATGYELQVSTDSSFPATALKIDKTDVNRLGFQRGYQETVVSLDAGVTYFWRVRAYVSAAAVGPWSQATPFRTQVAAPAPAPTATPVVSGPVAAVIFLANVSASGQLEIVTAFNYVSGKYEAYVPGLPGNPLLVINTTSVMFLNMKKDCLVQIGGKSFQLRAGIPTPLPIGDPVGTLTVIIL